MMDCREEFEKWLYEGDRKYNRLVQENPLHAGWLSWQAAWEASRRAQPTWIPVTERLPKSMEKVWTTSVDHPHASQVEAHVNDIGEWFTVRGYVDVTHWRPIPPPPLQSRQGGKE